MEDYQWERFCEYMDRVLVSLGEIREELVVIKDMAKAQQVPTLKSELIDRHDVLECALDNLFPTQQDQG